MHFLSNRNQQMIHQPKTSLGAKNMRFFDNNLIAHFSTCCPVEVIYGIVFIINKINWNSKEIVSLIGGISKPHILEYKCANAWSKAKDKIRLKKCYKCQ